MLSIPTSLLTISPFLFLFFPLLHLLHLLLHNPIFPPLALAIEVTNTSTCVSECGGGLTYDTDLVCNDADYDDTAMGRKMKDCLLCESTSTVGAGAGDGDGDGDRAEGQSDGYWFLFNQKYTLQYCLYENTANSNDNTSCESACEPLKPVLSTDWFESGDGMAGQYDYCELNGGVFGKYAGGCMGCLWAREGSVVLGNFLDTMASACESKPNTSVETIELPRALFDTATIASASASASSTAGIPASTGSGSSAGSISTPTSPASHSHSHSSLSTGAAAGIGVGVTLAVSILAAGTWFTIVFICRRRRQRTVEEEQGSDVKYKFSSPPQHLASVALVEADGRTVIERGKGRVELEGS